MRPPPAGASPPTSTTKRRGRSSRRRRRQPRSAAQRGWDASAAVEGEEQNESEFVPSHSASDTMDSLSLHVASFLPSLSFSLSVLACQRPPMKSWGDSGSAPAQQNVSQAVAVESGSISSNMNDESGSGAGGVDPKQTAFGRRAANARSSAPKSEQNRTEQNAAGREARTRCSSGSSSSSSSLHGDLHTSPTLLTFLPCLFASALSGTNMILT